MTPEQDKVARASFLAPIEIMAYDDNAAQEYGKLRAYNEVGVSRVSSCKAANSVNQTHHVLYRTCHHALISHQFKCQLANKL